MSDGSINQDSLFYFVTDGDGYQVQGRIDININQINDNPIVEDIRVSTLEEEVVTIRPLEQARDEEGDSLSIIALSSANGSSILNTETNTILFTPSTNFIGEALINYTVRDSQGGETEGRIFVDVENRVDNPIANDDIATTNEEQSVLISPLLNDIHPDGLDFNLLFASSNEGMTSIEGNDFIRFNPNEDYNGQATIVYEIIDTIGNRDTGIIIVTVMGENDAPVIDSSLRVQSIYEDSTLSLSMDNYVTDVDSADYSITSSNASEGTITINHSTKELIYRPNLNYNGTDIISVVISDGELESNINIIVTVRSLNDNPIITNQNISSLENQEIEIDISPFVEEVDGDDFFLFSAISNNGKVRINNNTLIYNPNINYDGNDVINYVVRDISGGSSRGLIFLNIQGNNQAPIVANGELTIAEDTETNIELLLNATDPENDSLEILNISSIEGTYTIDEERHSIIYTPIENFVGADEFSYQVSDGNGAITTVNFIINVVGVNDLPTIELEESYTIDEDTTLILDITELVDDIEDNTVRIDSLAVDNADSSISNEDLIITYNPSKDYFGTETLIVFLRDEDGGLVSASTSIIVNEVDNPIVELGEDRQLTINEGESITVNISDYFSSDDGEIVITSISVDNGTIEVSNNNKSFTYHSNNHLGQATVTVNLNDTDGVNTVYQFSVNVAGLARARQIELTVNEDEQLTTTLTNLVENLQNHTVSNISVENGLITIDNNGNITYNGLKNYNGKDSITLELSNGQKLSYQITINPVADAIIPSEENTIILNRWGATKINLEQFFIDYDNEKLSFSFPSTIKVNEQGGYVFNNNSNDLPPSLSIKATDSSSSLTRAITVIELDNSVNVPIFTTNNQFFTASDQFSSSARGGTGISALGGMDIKSENKVSLVGIIEDELELLINPNRRISIYEEMTASQRVIPIEQGYVDLINEMLEDNELEEQKKLGSKKNYFRTTNEINIRRYLR